MLCELEVRGWNTGWFLRAGYLGNQMKMRSESSLRVETLLSTETEDGDLGGQIGQTMDRRFGFFS